MKQSFRITRLAFSLALFALLALPATPLAADDDARCGDKIKKKEVTVYEVDFRYEKEGAEKVLAEHGVALEEVEVDTVQAERSIVKEARVRAADMGCPYVIVGPEKEEVLAIRYESSPGGAAIPREIKGYRALVVYAREADEQPGDG